MSNFDLSQACKALEIPEIAELPHVYNEESNKLRSIEEIAKRSTALYLLATYSDGVIQRNCPIEESQKYINSYIVKFKAADYFTEAEKSYLENKAPTDEEVGVYCWKWEAIHFMLWTCGFISDLGLPNSPCQTFNCAKVYNSNRSIESFSKASKILPLDKVIYLANFIEYVASCQNAKVDVGVLSEWRKAAQWLLSNQSWE